MRNYVLSCVAVAFLGALAFMATPQEHAAAHCQVPCGIYDDPARVHHMLEDVTTIAKAVDQIGALAAKTDALSQNQVTRWIMTKEAHASDIITTVAEYFLTQKVAEVPAGDPARQAYLDSLADHHHVMRAAMKTKQTVDAAAVQDLKTAVEALAKRYP